MKAKPFAGLLILAAVAGAVFFLQQRGEAPSGEPGTTTTSKEAHTGPLTTVSCFVGGEKSRYLANPEVKRILAERYGLKIDAVKAGSIEMVTTLPVDGKSCLWPSNQVATELYAQRATTRPAVAQETVFNSPIVFYTWDVVADAFEAEGLIEARDGVWYLSDLPALIDHLQNGTAWKDVGLPQLFGKMKVASTDPRKSNSGNMFSGLLANMMNGGEVVSGDQVEAVLKKLKAYFDRMGYMESSSGDIFENFLKTGVGAKPIIVGYENQLIELAIEHAEYQDLLRQKIRTLYPVPTVWSSHPIIALDDKGKQLIAAFEDEDLQDIAWRGHGFRSGLLGVENDPSALPVIGLPLAVESVMPMPSAAAMGRIIDGL